MELLSEEIGIKEIYKQVKIGKLDFVEIIFMASVKA